MPSVSEFEWGQQSDEEKTLSLFFYSWIPAILKRSLGCQLKLGAFSKKLLDEGKRY